jgi:hypothetical protein
VHRRHIAKLPDLLKEAAVLTTQKIRVRTSSCDQEVVILDRQVLEPVALGKSLRLVRAPKPQKYLDYEPTGFADAGVRLLRQLSHCDAYGVTRCVTM